MADIAISTDLALRRFCESRLIALRNIRYSWWNHCREVADYLLPRRYRWLVTPNQMSRGSPINQHILDSTGTLAARNLASGMMSGISSPTRPWFKLKIGRLDSTQTTPVSLWLAECERLMMLVFAESNFYTSIAVLYFDLVIFGTAVMLIYDDFDDVIWCQNPCFGEYYIGNDGKYRPCIFYREFTQSIDQIVEYFGIENCSPNVKEAYEKQDGAARSREIIIAHAIEPNDQPEKYGIPKHFKFREVYWEYGGAQGLQQGTPGWTGFLRKTGFIEAPNVTVRWDLASNDAYGRSPGMDALPDVKQLQQETRRKAQAIDKHVNPPMVGDVQLKNQPASLLPGGVTYVSGMTTGKVGFAPAYTVQPELQGITEDLNEVRERIKKVFFNDVLQPISQYETKSNVTVPEIDARRAEGLLVLGPVLERIEHEGLKPVIERVFPIMARAGIFPPPPAEIAGKNIDIEFVSMLATAQAAASGSGIERIFQVAGSLAGIDPAIVDNIDFDYGFDKLSSLLNNDPKLIRSPEQLAGIRQQRQQQQQQQQQAELAEKLAAGAKTLSEADVGGGQNALQRMTGSGVGA